MPIFVEHWGNILQFYPNFALFSTLGGMNLYHNFFQVRKFSEDQKKRSSPKLEEFFSPTSSEDQKTAPNVIQPSDADQSQIIGGGVKMYTIIKLFGGCPSGFGTPATKYIFQFGSKSNPLLAVLFLTYRLWDSFWRSIVFTATFLVITTSQHSSKCNVNEIEKVLQRFVVRSLFKYTVEISAKVYSMMSSKSLWRHYSDWSSF